MFKTPFGLRLRGIGIKEAERPPLASTPCGYKWQAILLGGLLGGMSGAFLTIGGASMFTEKISGGYGYLALAAIMVGDAKPGEDHAGLPGVRICVRPVRGAAEHENPLPGGAVHAVPDHGADPDGERGAAQIQDGGEKKERVRIVRISGKSGKPRTDGASLLFCVLEKFTGDHCFAFSLA